MKTTVENLVNYDWNGVVLYGKKYDESTWRWDTEQRYAEEEVIATATGIYKAATGYESLIWEIETEEGEEGYEEECEARDEWMNEEVNFTIDMLKIAGVFDDRE